MSVNVDFGGGLGASIQDGVWTCQDPAWLETLNTFLPEGGPSGSDPDPDFTTANAVVRALGGRVFYSRDESQPAPEPIPPDAET